MLLLGILSTAFFPLGVASLAMGVGARNDIARSGGSQSGGGMVAAGMALAVLGIVVWLTWGVLLATA